MRKPTFFQRILTAVATAWRGVRLAPPLGPRGERAAERYLRHLGWSILARNARDDLGEIDLVALDGRIVVFVEVKTRQAGDPGQVAEAVDAPKQRRLTRLALAWLKRRGLLEYPARFDVVAVSWPTGSRRPDLQHYRNAFEAVGLPGMYS